MMIKEIDLDIDYNKVVDEYYKLDIDGMLLKANHLKQISIQCRIDCPVEDQLYESCGSLYYDWVKYAKNPVGPLPIREKLYQEEEFVHLCDIFKNTYFEHVLNQIQQKYNVIRGRFMLMQHKTCLTYHTDPSPRLHIPIYTNENCMMIVDDKVIRLPFGNTYVVDTRLPHTALNASKDPRVHLVFCVDKF